MRRLFLLLLGMLAFATQMAASSPRYCVVWADGTRSESPEIENWGAANWKPSLARHLIFDNKNPARLIIDTTLTRRRRSAPYLELQSGDRLAGRVMEYREADAALGLPAHFLVEPSLALDLPGVFTRLQVRVRADAVRRIVAQRDIQHGKSSNWLQTVDGRRETFRSWRWRSTGLDVLTGSGVRHFELPELAAVEIDRASSWEAWLRQLAVLSPALDSPLISMELSDGSHLTTSLERLLPLTFGGEGADCWFHLCQPAWSLDLLAVPYRQVRMRCIFKPTETPLGVLEPALSRGQGIVAAPVEPHANENLEGEGLHCAGSEFGWGIAVHAPHELAFDLPQSARTFRTRLGLDAAVGDGGCARGFIRLDGKTLFASPLLVGSQKVAGGAPLPVGGGRLVLIADAAVKERPANADPFDIRDNLNWLEPVVEHDAVELRRDVERQSSSAQPALSGWTSDAGDVDRWRLVNLLDEVDAAGAGFRQVIALEGPLTLSRRVAAGPSSRTVHLTLGRSIVSEAVSVEIWVDSQRAAHETLFRQRAAMEPSRIAIPLPDSSENSVLLKVRLAPIQKPGLIDWRGVSDEHGKPIADR